MGASLLWRLTCYGGGVGVALGAFGAHGLKNHIQDPKLLQAWDTAVKYHLVHSLVGLVSVHKSPFAAQMAFLGNLLFAGSLYALVLTGIKKLGIITPFGGVLYIISWIALAESQV